MILQLLETKAGYHGLDLRGGFHPAPEDEVPAGPDSKQAGTLVLLGFAGDRGWKRFAGAPEAHDGKANALDRWSRRIIDELACAFGARAVYPFPTDRPPWFPFQRWARRAEALHPSPLFILIHPDWGLWHSYRGALIFSERLDVPAIDPRPSPCDACIAKPCLSACPVSAFKPDHFDDQSCATHLGGSAGVGCLGSGCIARRACPVGAQYRYSDAQCAFHMRAFHARHSRRATPQPT